MPFLTTTADSLVVTQFFTLTDCLKIRHAALEYLSTCPPELAFANAGTIYNFESMCMGTNPNFLLPKFATRI
jgi:hypothetical protein